MFKKQVKPKVCGQILLIHQEDLLPGPFKLRHFYKHKDLEQLANSIRKHGILQPLHVRQKGGLYQVVMGHRRLRAARMAGLVKIPCLIIEATDKQALTYSLIENKHRQAPGLFEEIEAIEKSLNFFKPTYDDLELITGQSEQEIKEGQKLLKLPEDIRKTINNNNITKDVALLLLRLPNNNIREAVLEEIIKNNLSYKEALDLVRTSLSDDNGRTGMSKILYKDIRVFTNTIDRAVQEMKESNISVNIEKKETPAYIKYIIEIPISPKKTEGPKPEIQLVK